MGRILLPGAWRREREAAEAAQSSQGQCAALPVDGGNGSLLLNQTMAEPMPEASEPGPLRQIGFRRRRGKKPKVALKQAKLQKGDATVLRMLPPGTFTDYLELLKARHKPSVPISLKLFSADRRRMFSTILVWFTSNSLGMYMFVCDSPANPNAIIMGVVGHTAVT